MPTGLRPIVSLLLAVALLLMGHGLQITLLPLRGNADGFGAVALGVIASAYYVGFVSGCLLAPYLILRAGHIRAFTAMLAVAAAVALGYALAPNVFAWILMRLITGFCLAGFYLVVESWLNDGASNENRGRVMSAYVVVNFAALTVGQMLVTVYPIGEGGGFMIAAMLTSLAIVPVALTKSAQPAPITIVTFHPIQLYQVAPVALVASFMVGITSGAFWGLAPLSAAGSGLDVDGVALFMSIAVAAGALSQWPLGRLSDRVDRRLVLLALLIGAAITGVLLWLVAASKFLLLTFGFLFGAMALPTYSLAAAHGYDKTPAADMVATAATILLANAIGSVIGPLIASAVMSGMGPRGLFLFTAVIQALLAVYVFYRTRVQAQTPVPDKHEFDLATTAPVGAVAQSELLDPTDPSVAVPDTFTPPPTANDVTDLPLPGEQDGPR
jgi:MFS family permease